VTGRRPVYFKQPAWPVTGMKITACACHRQAGAGRQAGRMPCLDL